MPFLSRSMNENGDSGRIVRYSSLERLGKSSSSYDRDQHSSNVCRQLRS